MYPPVLLLSYQATWLGLTFVAFAFLFVSAGAQSLARGFELSGSSLFTLGTTSAVGAGQFVLSYLEAAIGLTLLGLLIAFIPTIYGAFQRRELAVSRLSVRAGVPATPWGILEIAQCGERLRQAGHAVGRMGVVVHRAARDPHDAHDPQLLPHPDPRADLDRVGGRGPRLGRPLQRRGRPAAVGLGGTVHPVGLARASWARRLLPDPVPAPPRRLRARSRSTVRSSSSRSTTWRAAACPCSPTTTRRGSTSSGGA